MISKQYLSGKARLFSVKTRGCSGSSLPRSIGFTADLAEYAAMHGISYDAAIGVFALIGWHGIQKIITRETVAVPAVFRTARREQVAA